MRLQPAIDILWLCWCQTVLFADAGSIVDGAVKDPCMQNNGDCQHNCTFVENGVRKCSCVEGYLLHKETDCIVSEFDPCKDENGGCEHKCTSVSNHRVCSCLYGFLLYNTTHCKKAPPCAYEDKGCFRAFSDPCTVNNGGCEIQCNYHAELAIARCSCGDGYIVHHIKGCAKGSVGPYTWQTLSLLTFAIVAPGTILLVGIVGCRRVISRQKTKRKQSSQATNESHTVSQSGQSDRSDQSDQSENSDKSEDSDDSQNENKSNTDDEWNSASSESKHEEVVADITTSMHTENEGNHSSFHDSLRSADLRHYGYRE